MLLSLNELEQEMVKNRYINMKERNVKTIREESEYLIKNNHRDLYKVKKKS